MILQAKFFFRNSKIHDIFGTKALCCCHHSDLRYSSILGNWKPKKKDQVTAIIKKSKKLTTLKIKTLIPDEAVNDLVCIAFEACPKLTQLEILIGERGENVLVKQSQCLYH